jgi:hypothetical protein
VILKNQKGEFFNELHFHVFEYYVSLTAIFIKDSHDMGSSWLPKCKEIKSVHKSKKCCTSSYVKAHTDICNKWVYTKKLNEINESFKNRF